jgi:hypothetical protein
MNRPEQNDEESLRAPERLVTELKRLSSVDLFIPRSIDDAVLLAARKALQPSSPKRAFRFRLVPWLTAATAMVLLGVFLWLQSAPQRSSIASGDVNRDGRTDILDAFVLARDLKAGAPVSRAMDMNGDRLVDARDVLTVAAQAVQIEKGGG